MNFYKNNKVVFFYFLYISLATIFFLEVHPNPDSSTSDGPNSVRLSDFEKIIDDIVTFSYKNL